MFSEYASKFLAQSQSRLSFGGQPDNNGDSNNTNPTRPGGDWPSSRPSALGGRSFLGRGTGPGAYRGNPYQTNAGSSRFGQLAFASRITAADDAPLFHGALPGFREEAEDEEEERDRDAADLYALQRSRRVAAASKMVDSSETEPGASRDSLMDSIDQSGDLERDEGNSRVVPTYTSRAFGRGIRSSWNGARSSFNRPPRGDDRRGSGDQRINLLDDDQEEDSQDASSKGKMVDVGLDSQMADDDYDDRDDDPPESLLAETPTDTSPPAFQKFQPRNDRNKFFLRRESTQESELDPAMRQSSDDDVAPSVTGLVAAPIEGEIFKHDPFFAWLFLILLAGLLSTTVLVWLNTSVPDGKRRLGDTIYTTLHSSFHMLAVDTVVAVMVSLVWLAALRSFVRPLVVVIIVAVPIISISFSLYPFISSFEGSTHGRSLQDRALRWAALAPAIFAVVWIYLVIKSKHAIRQAVAILEFSSRILAANSALLLVGMGSLILIIAWTWMWLGMFTRVFLGGHFNKGYTRFIISVSSWWLGVGFILMYLWSIAVIGSVQRATTGATVSQWYFHRNAVPAPTSREIVTAAMGHATTTIFGTICQSTLIALLIRAPMLVLPSRLSLLLAKLVNAWIPTSVLALTNPLTISYSAIHSLDLVNAARGLSQLEFLRPDGPTMTLTPRVVRDRRANNSPLLPYRLAKLLLMATRYIMATALGFAGWVITAKRLEMTLPDGLGIRGSAYAYVVGIVATFIGFSVMGAMEGILSGIVDAVVICYGSEKRMASGGGGYCMEAAYLFGDRRRENGDDMA